MPNILKLIELYPNVPKEVLKQYKDADESFWMNTNDRTLRPFEVNVKKLIKDNFKARHPKLEFPEEDLWLGYNPKLWHKIENFGLPAKDQKWKVPELPAKLKKLQQKASTVEEIREQIEANREYYATEIRWIQSMWHKRIYGHWVFIKGKPTYIDGWQFFYCGFWQIDIGLPEYRDRDRRFFLATRYAYRTEESFFKWRRKIATGYQYTNNEKEQLVWKEKGYTVGNDGYIVDYGMGRTCYGINYPKGRREGATSKAECINFEICTADKNKKGGIQSMDETHGKKAFQFHLIQPYKSLPFFFKPVTNSGTSPVRNVRFESPAKKGKNGGTYNLINVGLQSFIDYASTAKRGYYDGEKLSFYHDDETGKVLEEKVDERWEVVKQALSLGNGSKIIGLVVSTSTVGEMTDQGGEAFWRLCRDSHWEQRMTGSGQTKSGRINIFMPAEDGLEGFIDEYGYSIIETPAVPVVNSEGKTVRIGAKEYLDRMQEELLGKGDPESVRQHQENKRLFPRCWDDCFVASASDTGFNMRIIQDRITDLMTNEELQPVKGDFRWKVKWQEVEWIPSPTGKWNLSLTLPPDQANLMVEVDGKKMPRFPDRFISCGDAFRFTKTQGYRMSNGGHATFWKYDRRVDENVPIENWKSNRYVCSYNNRTDNKDEYAEDVLMECIYFGSMQYPEINVTLIWDKFVEWGFDGYLMYDYDPMHGIYRETPGFSSLEKTKQNLFLGLKHHIELHGHRERHLDILMECKKIRGLEEMTKYDLFTSAGGCQLGLESSYAKLLSAAMGVSETGENSNTIDYGAFVFGN